MQQTDTKESKWDMPEELQALMDKVGKDIPAPA
jgi:pre-mRNA-processing factor 40